MKKKNKTPKCRNCDYKVELEIIYAECISCSCSGEYYKCPECSSNFDIKTREEL